VIGNTHLWPTTKDVEQIPTANKQDAQRTK
jgi:hypothetical protein